MDANASAGPNKETVRIFVSYAREDAKWLDPRYPFNLIPFLAETLRRYNATFWYDKELKPGDEFKRHIEAEIDQAGIALLIVSYNFLSSQFIESREMPRIAERAGQGKMIVVPVLVEPCDWSDYSFLADRQMVPTDPLIEYTESEAKWAKVKSQILEGLKAQVKRIREDSASTVTPAGSKPKEAILPYQPPDEMVPQGQGKVKAVLVSTEGLDKAPPAMAELRTIRPRTEVDLLSLCFSRDGTTIASGNTGETINFWNVATGAEVMTLRGNNGYVFCVAFDPDGSKLASGAMRQVKLWSTATGDELRTLRVHSGIVYCVAFSPDGLLLASGGDDRTVKLSDATTGTEMRSLCGHADKISSIAFSPDGRTLASASRDKTIKLWDVRNGECLKTLASEDSGFSSIAFNPRGGLLASGSEDGSVKVRDVGTGRVLWSRSDHFLDVYSVAYSPDGSTIASGGLGSTVILYDSPFGNLLAEIQSEGSYSLAFSPDCHLLASASSKTIKLWDVNRVISRN